MPTLDTVTFRLQADVAQFQQGLNQASGGVQNLAGTTTRANGGMRFLRQGMSQLAIQAAGVSGPVGRISEGLVLLSTGAAHASVLLLEVAALIAVLGLAYRELTRDSRDTIKAQDDLVKALDQVGDHARIVGQRIKIASLEAQKDLTTLQQLLIGGAIGVGLKPELAFQLFGPNIEDLNRQIAAAKNSLSGAQHDALEPFNQALAESAEKLREAQLRFQLLGEVLPTVDEAIRRLELGFKKFTPTMAAQIAANERLTAQLDSEQATWRDATMRYGEARTRLDHFGESVNAVTEAVRTNQLILQGWDPTKAASQAGFERKTQVLFDQLHLQEQLANLGAQAGHDLVMGLIEGIQSGADLLRNVVLTFLDFGITQVFKTLFAIASPSKVAMGWGLNIGQGLALGLQASQPLVAGASLGVGRSMAISLHADMGNLPAPATPFDIARDAQWQRVFRETSVVARSQGFR